MGADKYDLRLHKYSMPIEPQDFLLTLWFNINNLSTNEYKLGATFKCSSRWSSTSPNDQKPEWSYIYIYIRNEFQWCQSHRMECDCCTKWSYMRLERVKNYTIEETPARKLDASSNLSQLWIPANRRCLFQLITSGVHSAMLDGPYQ